MAQFLWKQYPDEGACVTCGSATNPRGFVDFISEVNVMRNDNTIAGVIDVIVCATCLEQAAGVIGSPTKQESEDWAHQEKAYQEAIEKLKDEVAAWQSRLMSLANLSVSDFEALAQLEEKNKVVVPTTATSEAIASDTPTTTG